jgi:transcriptional regulator with XRE-family HTH domain
MAAGKEIKRLRGNISTQKIAGLIGIDVERLRKWEQRDVDPKDIKDIKQIEWYFGCKVEDLTKLDNFNFVQKEKLPSTPKSLDNIDYQTKYIALLEEQKKILEDQLDNKKALERELVEMRKEFNDFRLLMLSNLKEYQEDAAARLAYLKTVLRSQTLHRAKTEKVSVEKLNDEIDTILVEETDHILKIGK